MVLVGVVALVARMDSSSTASLLVLYVVAISEKQVNFNRPPKPFRNL